MNRRLIGGGLLLGVIGAASLILGFQDDPQAPPPTQPALDIYALLTDRDKGFARVDNPWQFRFPADHGAHSDFRTESWSITGYLTTAEDRPFGFRLSFFRLALAPEPPELDSAWATNQIYGSHFTLTDGTEERFYPFERFSRAALGLSGAVSDPPRVWLEDWSLQVSRDQVEAGIFHLQAGEETVALRLRLQPDKPLILSGNDSSAESPLPGGTFYGYLATRLSAQGSLRIAGDTFEVTGQAWLDRAWGEIPLSRGQLALNRFLLQLDDGREILCFQLRRRDGSGVPITTGLLISEDGSYRSLGRRDMTLEALAHWQSPQDGTRYPVRWRLRIPGQTLELDIKPLIAAQEIRGIIRYWSGTVQLTGYADGQSITGNGHIELTNYAKSNHRP